MQYLFLLLDLHKKLEASEYAGIKYEWIINNIYIVSDEIELHILIQALYERVNYAGSLLVKQLKKRDALKSKQEKICNVITAHLQANSFKRSKLRAFFYYYLELKKNYFCNLISVTKTISKGSTNFTKVYLYSEKCIHSYFVSLPKHWLYVVWHWSNIV